jgi:hypothetical protein
MSKPFSEALYGEDDSAKHLVVEWLRARGHDIGVNPDEYGIDLVGNDRGGLPSAWEVEVKHNWKGSEFPFDTVHYAVRKRKFVQPDVKTWFITLNHERTRAVVFAHKHFMEGRLVQKSTIYTQDEWFVEIPVRQGIFINLENGGVNDTSTN